jgi:hypothetical protein
MQPQPYAPYPDEHLKEWFKDHKAKAWNFRVGNAILEMIDWRKSDGSSFYYIRYMMIQGILHVTGDVGDAIHGWSWSPDHPWGMKDVAGCDLGYYMSKTLASSEGEKGEVWNEKKAEYDLVRYFEQRLRDESGLTGDLKKAAWQEYRGKCEKQGKPCLYDRDEFRQWVVTNGNKFLGEYWRESLGDVGMETSPRHRAHLLGLKMALDQKPAVVIVDPT